MINLIPGSATTSSALNSERIRMDVISQNIANVNTTRDLNGKPYQRQHVVFETFLGNAQTGERGLQVSRVEKDNAAPRLVYNPGHPDADAQGMVAMPDINIHQEMVDLISSSRVFEANLAVVKNARQMAMQTLSIAKR